jgi:protein-S-isoprenylcysteine O-methyltransferase Ste14
MQPLAFTEPGAEYAFDALLLAFVVTEFVIRIRSYRNRGSESHESASLIVIVVSYLVAVVGAVLVATRVTATAIPVGRLAFLIAGLVVLALSLALRIWAVVALGRYFTVDVRVREHQPVVDTGPYRVLRHPSYTGLLGVMLGFGLALDNWLALLVAVVPPTIAIVVRIRVEERALLTVIGEPYRAFAATRSRLIPHVW